ncbi:ATP-dependent DNA helicase [Trichonephila clavipes]|uniref:ATP-dependent DNA helicase n=1 Tax=Trichonephila clavipes TaxID=2585209 RepID=A0A8X6RPX6_TRICX|nr:ATP-dependent DNA helicase [Trichonephila clavipes]
MVTAERKYLRCFQKETQTGEDGYPQYHRRSPEDGGIVTQIKGNNVDNRWVVPYNPVLSRTFNAHINVEFYNSVKSIKYICKYVNKRTDQATFSVEYQDEVTRYESGRYISSSEAVWWILCFPIHERFPPVMHLSVHLENGQTVYFTKDSAIHKIINPQKTTLMAFFELCQVDNFAKTLLYCEVPAYYVWKNSKFYRRKKGKAVSGYPESKKDQVLRRVYTVHSGNAEWSIYIVQPSFQAACKALGLLEDDAHWNSTLEEASISESLNKIREFFAIILVFCQIGDPMKLWEKHRDSLSEDVKKQIEAQQGNIDLYLDIVYSQCLILLEDIVISMSGKALLQFGFLSPSREARFTISNHQYVKELAYDTVHLNEIVAENIPKLNQELKEIYDKILNSISSNSGQCYFLDSPGGTGKTFLINLLLAKIRCERSIAIAVASSGIAATLIHGGKTAHSAFKLPLNLHHSESVNCNISKQSDMAHVLREAKLIICDECTMAHKKVIEALNRTLQDIRGYNQIMGGLTVLLSGDFRQTLPVVLRGTRADIVKACLKTSFLWPHIKVVSLRINMRVHLQHDLRAEKVFQTTH